MTSPPVSRWHLGPLGLLPTTLVLLMACTGDPGSAGGSLTPGSGDEAGGEEGTGEEGGGEEGSGEEGSGEEGTGEEGGGDDSGTDGGGDTSGDSGDTGTTDSLLAGYTADGDVDTIEEIAANLSGITWNPVTETLMTVLDSNKTLWELDTAMAPLREIKISNITKSDTEDIVWVGQETDGSHTYAVVTEESAVFLGTVPHDGSLTVDFAEWQTITWADPPESGNRGGEGIAYDHATATFYVCKEKDPMAVHSFARPTTSEDVSFDDGSLTVTELFDAEALLSMHITDISACMFDDRSGRLLVLSHESSVVLDVDLSGKLHGTLDVNVDGGDMSKAEGITLLTDGTMVIVGEPNQWRRYTFVSP